MHVEAIRQYCLSLHDVEESLPFGPGALVFKTGGKIFVILSLDEEQGRMTVKCDPERALMLREEYPTLIIPGYHTNKKHWNTVLYEQLPPVLVHDMINHSYMLVMAGRVKRR